MVCGTEPYCIYQTLPQCDCDWGTGLCKNEEFDELSLLKKRGLEIGFSLPSSSILEKDSDFNPEDILLIKEILARHKSKKELEEISNPTNDFIETYGHSIHSFITIFIFIMLICTILFMKRIDSELKEKRDLENQKEK
jgi:cbb3-type cytochrome oxidase subunit 3